MKTSLGAICCTSRCSGSRLSISTTAVTEAASTTQGGWVIAAGPSVYATRLAVGIIRLGAGPASRSVPERCAYCHRPVASRPTTKGSNDVGCSRYSRLPSVASKGKVRMPPGLLRASTLYTPSKARPMKTAMASARPSLPASSIDGSSGLIQSNPPVADIIPRPALNHCFIYVTHHRSDAPARAKGC